MIIKNTSEQEFIKEMKELNLIKYDDYVTIVQENWINYAFFDGIDYSNGISLKVEFFPHAAHKITPNKLVLLKLKYQV